MIPRIFLIDDQQDFLETIQDGLETAASVRARAISIYTESDPRRVEARLKNRESWPDGAPQIFLIDLQMPYLDGFAVASVVEGIGWIGKPPIIYFTATKNMVSRRDVERRGGALEGRPVIFKGDLDIKELYEKILSITGAN